MKQLLQVTLNFPTVPPPFILKKIGVPDLIRQPFAMYDEIMVPKDFGKKMTASKARHEFAHTVRHTLDGDVKHFLGDAAPPPVGYFYTQSHECKKKTNEGFAFNEGWCVSVF